MKPTFAICAGTLLLLAATAQAAENRETKVRGDKTEVEATGLWIYNDLAQAYAEARQTRKPMLVVFRCVP